MNLKVSSAVRRPDGIHLRLVYPHSPAPAATIVEPNLEDSFVYWMNFAGAVHESGMDQNPGRYPHRFPDSNQAILYGSNFSFTLYRRLFMDS